jgi:glucosamine--fructose-6-phosphate aminotransferase (isomerizing)
VKDEIYEIPYRAELCYRKNKGVILPENVPYLGMGASNIATSIFRYLGIQIMPERSAEYYNYLIKYHNLDNGVLISQSGQSSETLWCADYFKSFLAIVNTEDSPLASHPNCAKQICLYSGKEELIPAKTYINTLLVLYLGFGFNPSEIIDIYHSKFDYFEEEGNEIGARIQKKTGWRSKKCVYILGNGPNIASAKIAALLLSEITKLPVTAMSAAQYDHGFKETAKNCLVFALNHDGPETDRTIQLIETIKKAGAEVYILNAISESIYSPLTFPVSFYFAAIYLTERMRQKETFLIGKKITRVSSKT